MAHCKYSKEELMALHDGELPARHRRELERHVEDCPACAAELAELRALCGLLSEARAPAMPDGLMARLHEAVPAAREYSIVRLCRAVALAAALLLLAGGALLIQETARHTRTSAAPAAWEMAAVTLDGEMALAGPGEAMALWTVNDLSRENGQ